MDYSRAPCLGADQKARGLWERDCSKTDLDGITHEQTIICRQLSAGHVVGSQPMKMGEKIHRMIKTNIWNVWKCRRHLFITLTSQKLEKHAWDTRGYSFKPARAHMTPCIACEKARVKLEPFYRLFRELFCNIFLVACLITCLNGVWNYCYVYRSDLTPFKCWSGFRFFLGLIASFWQARLILTSGRQWWRALLSLRKTLVSHLKEARKSFSLHARAMYTKMHTSVDWIKISSPEVKCCVKSREPEIKSEENIWF